MKKIGREVQEFFKKERNQWILFSIAMTAIVALFIYNRMGLGGAYDEKQPVAECEALYQAWASQPSQVSWDKLQGFVKKYPTLKPYYEGRWIQRSLTKGDGFLDRTYTENLLRSVEKEIGAYVRFSKGSLAIGQSDWKGGLDQTYQQKEELLQVALKSDKEEGLPLLFSYTLLRIAFLEKMAGHSQQELSAWKEVDRYLGLTTSVPLAPITEEAVTLVKENFNSSGSIGLAEYIAYRVKALQASVLP